MIAEGSRAPDFVLPGGGKFSHEAFNLRDAIESDNLLLIFCSGDILEEPMEYQPLEYAPWFQLVRNMNVWIVADSGLSSEVNQAIYPLNHIPVLLDRHNNVTTQYGIEAGDQTLNESSVAVVIIDKTRTVRLSKICNSNSRTIPRLKQVIQDAESSESYSDMKA